MACQITYREYSECDKEYVTTLMKELCRAYNVDFDEGRWLRSLDEKVSRSESTRMFVADKDGAVIGMLVSDVRNVEGDRVGFITNLIVAPDYRNMGVGESLVNQALDHFRGQHVNLVKVNIRARTHSALKLLARLGFEEAVVQLKRNL